MASGTDRVNWFNTSENADMWDLMSVAAADQNFWLMALTVASSGSVRSRLDLRIFKIPGKERAALGKRFLPVTALNIIAIVENQS